MVRVGWAALVGALAIAGAADAQVTKVTGLAGNSADTSPVTNFGAGKGEGPGGAYNSFISVTKNDVTFESANAASGPFAYSSFSNVGITFTNDGRSAVTPQVHSQITPAGLGFYLADTAKCSPGFGTCAQDMSATFGDLNLNSSEPITLASFSFSIVADDHTVFRASGQLGLQNGSEGIETFANFDDGAFGLNNFGLQASDPSSFGYNWDATDVDFSMFRSLNPGESDSVQYFTSVTSYSPSLCIGASSVCVVAYSGFGDPIGRGGGIDSLAVVHSLGLFSRPFDQPAPGIKGLQFSSYDLHPVFSNGVLDTTGGVPEPATWVSMILGFGVLGGALRRRRGLAAA
jgi:hypothetical protein